MKPFTRGFTLVELIIVIAVIAIIATIGLVSWNGVAVSARNKSRENDTKAWMGNFDIYRARFIVNPGMPTGDGTAGAKVYCLGSFTTTSSKCGQYASANSQASFPASDSAALLTAMDKVGNVPTNTGEVFKGVLAGPIAYTTQVTSGGTVTVTTQFINFFETSCPTGFTNINASLPTAMANVLTGLPSGSNAFVCSVTKTFSYTP